MMTIEKLRWMALGIGLTLGSAIGAQDSQAAETPAAAVPGKGTLALEVQQSATDSSKRLQVSVQPDGGTSPVSGNADVVGFPVIKTWPPGDADWDAHPHVRHRFHAR
jgi:hypothetical protein